MNVQKKSTLNKSIIKRLHHLYDYQMSRVDLQCRLYEMSKRHLCKRLIIRLKMLQCSISMKCLKLFIKIDIRQSMRRNGGDGVSYTFMMLQNIL